MESFLFNYRLGNDFDILKNTIFSRPQKNLENILFTDGMDGMWDGMDGMDGRGIKSVLQFSFYIVGTYIMYIFTYMCSQKLSPTLLWFSKFNVKLGSGGMIFKTSMGKRIFEKSS